jgi:hypothetical protein
MRAFPFATGFLALSVGLGGAGAGFLDAAQWAETPKTWPKSKKMMYVFQDFYLGNSCSGTPSIWNDH